MAAYNSNELIFTSVENGEGGATGDKVQFAYANASTAPTKPTTGSAPSSPWSTTPTTPPLGSYTWMTQTTYTSGGVYGTWTTPMRLSGLEGADGDGIQYIYYLSATDTVPATPETSGDPGWTLDPSGVSLANAYEFVSYRTGYTGSWSLYSTPVLWAKYGTDGIGVVYVYKTTTTVSAPSISGTGPDVPTGWTDELSGVDETNKYEWVSSSQYTDEAWGDYSTPKLYSRYTVDGEHSTSYWMIVNTASVKKSEAGAYTPDAVSAYGYSQVGEDAVASYTGYYEIEGWNGSTWTSLDTDTVSVSYTIAADYSIYRFSMYTSSGKTVLLDREEIPVVLDGSSTRIVDQDGGSRVFAGDTDSVADTEQAVVTVKGYKGSEANNVIIKKVNNVAASLSETPTGITGLTFQCSSITSAASPTITFKATTSMTSASGSIPIEVDLTADGVTTTFTKYFNYAISFMGVDGAEPQYVIVSGEQAFKYLAGVATPVSSPIVLSAALYGGLTAYDWEYWDGDSWEDLSGTQNTQDYSLAYNNTEWGTDTSLRIRCKSGDYWDEITIVKLYDGVDGENGEPGTNGQSSISGFLSNQAHILPADEYGEVTNYNGSGTDIRVIEGSTYLTYKSSLTTSSFTVGTPVISPIQSPDPAIVVGSFSGLNTTTCTVADYSAMDDGTNVVTITFPLTVKRANGDEISLNLIQTLSKTVAGAEGVNGVRTAVIELYKWAATEPTTDFPSGDVSYNWSTGTIASLPATHNNWTLLPGTGSAGNTLWACRKIYTDTLTSSPTTISFSATSAYPIGGFGTNGTNGDDGDPGVNGYRTARQVLYQWATTQPTAPSGSTTYTWATGGFTGPATIGNWSTSAGEGEAGEFLWENAEWISNNSTDASTTFTWGSTTVTSIGYIAVDGANGSNGSSGQNSAVVWLYKRSASTPAKPTTTSTYTFSLGTIEGQDNGWTQAVPEFNYYPLWAIQAVATATAPIDTNTIANTQWGSQIKIAENGADGVNGSNGLDGYNQATILLYQRATSTPVVTDIADPITYTFSNGAITGTIGSWVRDIASTTGENPLYVISCVAISSLTTDSIARSEWSTPVVMAENGTNGTEGVDSTSYWLICDTGAVSKDLQGNYTPSSITVTAKSKTGSAAVANYSGRFVIKRNGSIVYTSGANEYTKTYSITADTTDIEVFLYLAGGTSTLLDQQKIPVVYDGPAGEDAYTVLLGNESHTFAGTVTTAENGSTTSTVDAWKGSTKIAATIGTITGAPTGMSTSITNNGTTSAYFTVTVTTSMTTASGTLTVPVTVSGIQFTKVFSYAIAFTGQQGLQGTSGDDALQVMLLNEHQGISCTSSRVAVTSTPDATITIPFSAYLGSARIAGTAVVGTLPSGMTLTSNTPATESADGQIVQTITDGANFGGTTTTYDTGTIDITITANSVPIVKKFSWSKVIAGTTARTYFVEPSVYQIVKDEDGVYSPTSLTFYSYYKDGTSSTKTAYTRYWRIETTTDGSTWTEHSTSTTLVNNIAVNPIPASIVAIKATIYSNAALTSGYAQDYQTVAILADGATGETGATGPTGETGDPGTPGENATQYYLVPSVNTITRNLVVTISPTSITFTLYKTVGTGAPSVVTSGYTDAVQYSVNGSSYTTMPSAIVSDSSGMITVTLNNTGYDFGYGGDTTYKDVQFIRCIMTVGGVEVARSSVNFVLGDDLTEIAQIVEDDVLVGEGKVIANSIVAGAITAEKLSAGAITTGIISNTPIVGNPNLLDNKPLAWESGYVSDSTGAEFSSSSYIRLDGFVKIEPNTEYTYTNYSSESWGFNRAFYDDGGTFISGISVTTLAASSSWTFTTPANARRFRTSVYKSAGITADVMGDTCKVKFEIGDTATGWCEYWGEITNSSITMNSEGLEIKSGGKLILSSLEEIFIGTTTMKIGSTNLLHNSKDERTVTNDGAPPSETFISFNAADEVMVLDPDTQYTVSGWYSATANVSSVDIYLIDEGLDAPMFTTGTHTNGSYVYFSHTFTTPATAYNYWYLRFDNNGSSDDPPTTSTLKVKNIKVELGNVATDWCDAEGDLHNDSITLNDSGISITTGADVNIKADSVKILDANTDKELVYIGENSLGRNISSFNLEALYSKRIYGNVVRSTDFFPTFYKDNVTYFFRDYVYYPIISGGSTQYQCISKYGTVGNNPTNTAYWESVTNIVYNVESSINETINSIGKVQRNTTYVTVPAGIYYEDVKIHNFRGRLVVQQESNVIIYGTLTVSECDFVEVKAASKDSSMFIIPESRPYGAVVYIQACSNVYLENLVLRGYKGCTSYNDATLYGVSIQYSKAVLESCCIDFIGHTNVGNVFEIWTSTLISSDCYGGAAYYNGVYRYLNDCYLANLNNWSFWGSLGTKTPHVRSYVRTVSGDYSTPGWNPTQTPNLDLPASINTMELLEISLSSSVNVYCDIDTVSPESASLSTWSYGKYTNAQSGEKLGNGYKYACIMTTDPTTPTDISALLSSKTIVRATILFKMEECWRGATEKALYVFHTGTMPTNGDAYDTHMWTLGKNVSVSQIEECSTDITLEVGYYVANSYHLYGFGLGFEGDYVSVLYPILKVIYY